MTEDPVAIARRQIAALGPTGWATARARGRRHRRPAARGAARRGRGRGGSGPRGGAGRPRPSSSSPGGCAHRSLWAAKRRRSRARSHGQRDLPRARSIGESALFMTGGRRTATLTALEPSTVLVLQRQLFQPGAAEPGAGRARVAHSCRSRPAHRTHGRPDRRRLAGRGGRRRRAVAGRPARAAREGRRDVGGAAAATPSGCSRPTRSPTPIRRRSPACSPVAPSGGWRPGSRCSRRETRRPSSASCSRAAYRSSRRIPRATIARSAPGSPQRWWVGWPPSRARVAPPPASPARRRVVASLSAADARAVLADPGPAGAELRFILLSAFTEALANTTSHLRELLSRVARTASRPISIACSRCFTAPSADTARPLCERISWYRLPPRMGAAAFYDLDGTLVRTNLVHAFAFSARNQQGLLKSVVKTGGDAGQRPDVPGRRLLQPAAVQRHLLRALPGRVRGSAALPGRGAVRHRVAAVDFPRRLRAHRQIASTRTAPGAGDGRPGHHRAAARQAPEDRRLCDESPGVRRRLRDRAPAAAGDGRARPRRAGCASTPRRKT